MLLALALLLAGCARHACQPADPPADPVGTDVAAQDVPPDAPPDATADEDLGKYLPLSRALESVAAGESAEVCVTGEYQAGFERSALVDGDAACWAAMPVELPPSPVRRSAIYRATVEACGTLTRAAEGAGSRPGGGGFGHLGAYTCQFKAEAADRTIPYQAE